MIIFLVLLVIFIGFALFSSYSPILTVYLARHLFFRIPKEKREKEYVEDTVRVLVNQEYPSNHLNNRFDLYLPPHQLEAQPIIVWIPGGGFVGGDKLDTKNYATALSKEGFVVAVMNYELGPTMTYPEPLIQTSEFFTYLIENSPNYPINMNNLFIAGDSAGAQIASQFMATQLNEDYCKSLNLKKILHKEQVRGILLYCGLYDLLDLVRKKEYIAARFFFKGIGWSAFKNKKWYQSETAETALTGNFLTASFPPTYLTDGNTLSFEKQGKHFAQKLRNLGIPVSERFFDTSAYRTLHEFQFQLKSKPAKIVFNDTLHFLHNNRQNVDCQKQQELTEK